MKNVSTKILAATIFYFVFSSSAFSATRCGQDLVPSGHWVYDALAQIEIDVGRWHFIDQTPLSIQTIQGILDEVPYEKLSEAGKAQYKRILDYFDEFDISLDIGILSLGIEPKANIEGYVKTNEDLPWIYGNHERKRTIEVPWRITLSDFLTVYMGFALGQRRSFLENEDYNFVNHFFTEDAFDPNLTHSTYLSTGYKWKNNIGFNFHFGYGKQTFGRGLMGSTILSDYLTDVPYLQLRVYSPIFCYSFNVQQFNPKTTLYTHTIDFRLFKKLNIGMMEGGAAYNDFDMRFINPFALFHAYDLNDSYDWISYFAVKASFVPVKNIRIYLLYAMDEHQMATEDRSSPDALPEANALQGGLNLQFPVKSGFLKFNLEGYYSAPYFMIKQSPNWSLVSAKDGTYEWIGSPVGPDSLAGKFNVEYEKPGKWSLGFNYIFAARGEFSSFSIFEQIGWNNEHYDVGEDWIYPHVRADYENMNFSYVNAYGRDYKTPHGITEYDNIIYLRGSLSPTKWLTLVAQPTYVFEFNANHKEDVFEHGFEFALSCRIEFCKLMKKPANLQFLFKDRHDREQEVEENE